ncbi:MAG TPA: Kdo hydroxylase family protein [Gammaproteobacteria bacterium]|nr:Kdo hydroxylase family protein [Gammaproteobacteria bacterium]
MLHTLTTSSWTEPLSTVEQESAITALEDGKVLYFPNLSFEFSTAEQALLTPDVLSAGFKNISFNPKNGKIKGTAESQEKSLSSLMTLLMVRFFNNSRFLLNNIIPHYQGALQIGRTSYRPIEVLGRKTSLLKDDTRLHIDAFPATPNQGKRILRVFSNVNPENQARLWHLGEPFEQVVQQFLPVFKNPFFGYRKLLSLLKITKSYRSLYDHMMLTLHDEMKKSNVYQNKVQKTEMPFPAGSTWVVMTDCVSHAALSGQFLLEQTFYLAPSKMKNPEKSPLRVLEKMLCKKLV